MISFCFKIITQADPVQLARKLGLDYRTVHDQQYDLYEILSFGVSPDSASDCEEYSD